MNAGRIDRPGPPAGLGRDETGWGGGGEEEGGAGDGKVGPKDEGGGDGKEDGEDGTVHMTLLLL